MKEQPIRTEVREITASKLLNQRRILIEEGLYQEHDLSVLDAGALTVFRSRGNLDCYCPKCRQTATFWTVMKTEEVRHAQIVHASVPASFVPAKEPEDRFTITLACSRVPDHRLEFYFAVKDQNLQKVGQVPSVADLAVGELQRFRRVADEETLMALQSAVILHAHGFGIGAFAYLRRAFEHVIEEAHHQAVAKETGWDEEAFKDAYMSDKIVMLKNHLPEILVRNAALYGILSTGVHELREDKCKAHFPIIREGIEYILEMAIQKREQEHRERKITSEVGRLASELGKRAEGTDPT